MATTLYATLATRSWVHRPATIFWRWSVMSSARQPPPTWRRTPRVGAELRIPAGVDPVRDRAVEGKVAAVFGARHAAQEHPDLGECGHHDGGEGEAGEGRRQKEREHPPLHEWDHGGVVGGSVGSSGEERGDAMQRTSRCDADSL